LRTVNPDDRRSIVIGLGPKSRHLLPRLIPEFRHVENGLLDGFDKREAEQLSSMLRRLLANARRLNS
jgi:DNA-binding MarR family transcriptional regulator